MDFPESVQQKTPSYRVVVRVLGAKVEEPKAILPNLEPRGNHSNRVVQQLASLEVFQTVSRVPRATEPAADGFTKTGPGGPPIAPSSNQANNVTVLETF